MKKTFLLLLLSSSFAFARCSVVNKCDIDHTYVYNSITGQPFPFDVEIEFDSSGEIAYTSFDASSPASFTEGTLGVADGGITYLVSVPHFSGSLDSIAAVQSVFISDASLSSTFNKGISLGLLIAGPILTLWILQLLKKPVIES